MKSGKVDFVAKVTPGPIPHSAATDSSAEKWKSAHTSGSERFTKSGAGEFPEGCTLLKADLLEDVNGGTKLVDSAGKVVVH